MVMKCKDCKYWKRYEERRAIWGRLRTIASNTSYGDCKNDNFFYKEAPKDNIKGLIYYDYENYTAGFETGQDFGCIHFEQK